MKLNVKYLENYDKEKWGPLFSAQGNSGYDLRAAIPSTMEIRPGETQIVPTGIQVELVKSEFCEDEGGGHWTYDDNLELQIRPRSGLAAKHGITIVNTPGTIDYSYRGELKVILHNTKPPFIWGYSDGWSSGEVIRNNYDSEVFVIEPGDRIAQLVVCPIYKPEVIEIQDFSSDTSRGENGFGSSGVK